MNAEQNQRILRQMASSYAEQYGSELLLELRELEDSGVSYLTPNLDRKIQALTGGNRRKYYLRTLAAAAACAALMLLLPRTGLFQQNASLPGEAGTAEQTALGDAEPEMDVAPELFLEEPAEAPIPEEAAERAAFDGAEPDMEAADNYATGGYDSGTPAGDWIPLSFDLPDNLWINYMEQDQGQTIYHLGDVWRDDIVMTLEYTPGEPNWSSYTEIDLNGETAYAIASSDYNVLTFEKEDIRYTMTCRYDVNSLIRLGRNIL